MLVNEVWLFAQAVSSRQPVRKRAGIAEPPHFIGLDLILPISAAGVYGDDGSEKELARA